MGKKEKRGKRKKRETKEKGFDSQCSEGQKSIGRELKLVFFLQATSRCKKKKKKVGFSETKFSDVETVFWNSCLRTLSWLNLEPLMAVLKVVKN